jgi:DsbC/DsbD-like thiol-disulfide interchange protein
MTAVRGRMSGNAGGGSRIQTRMRGRNRRYILSLGVMLGAAQLLCVAGTRAAGSPIPHGTLELIAEKQAIAPGHTVDLGLKFDLEKGWHIYWMNPGDSGEPPRVKWDLPAGITAGAIEWPTPHRLGTPSIVDFGYEDEVMLIAPLHADASMAGHEPVQVGAAVKVLVCREMCIPGKAQLSLTLPVKPDAPAADAQTAESFAAARRILPRKARGNWKFSVADAKDSLVLTASLGQRVTQAVFFPLAESQISNSAPQHFEAMPDGLRLTLRKSDQLLKPIERLKGVVVLTDERAYSIDVPVRKSGTPSMSR